ncbi:UPF0721 transmembrane protein [Deltaproteobacteria bacterium]|nr:UPF0721 transmembrane protein [Deltaproteobacteria bacterium]
MFFVIVLVALVVEAAAGFGATVVTVTFAAQLLPVDDVLAAFLPVNLLLSAWMVVRYRSLVDHERLFRRVLPLMGAGMAVGILLSAQLGALWLKALFALFVVILSSLELRRRDTEVQLSTAAGTAAMLGAGAIHGLFACGGPLLVWVLGREMPEKGRFRATLATVWLILGLALLVRYRLAGTLTLDSLRTSLWLLPALGLGLWLGERVHHRIPEAAFRRWIYRLLLFAGASLLARTITAFWA